MSQKDSLSKLKNFFRMDKNSSGELNDIHLARPYDKAVEQTNAMMNFYTAFFLSRHFCLFLFHKQGIVAKKPMQTCCEK